jgi:protein-disulfide isomerase
MNIMILSFIAAAMTADPSPSAAQSVASAADPCRGLSEAQAVTLAAVQQRVHPHDCCDDTLAACLAAAVPSRSVKRLAAEVCRRVAAGQPQEYILRSLERRAATLLPAAAPTPMDLEGVAWAGDPQAPVPLVAYACGRCPFCSHLVPALHRAVTEGPLKGRARLAIRPFPIRGHAGSTEAALGMEAARTLGAFWPYVLKEYQEFEGFSEAALVDWAAAVGLERAAFRQAMQDPALRERVVESKKEGLRNGVEATPTVFLGGRRYTGELDQAALVDAALEEADRLAGTQCKP